MFPIPTRTLLLILFLILAPLSEAHLQFSSPASGLSTISRSFEYVDLTPRFIFPRGQFTGQFKIHSLFSNACDPIPALPIDDYAARNRVVIATWGGCHIAQKVMNAELSGAKMLIVILPSKMPLDQPSLHQLPIKGTIEILAIINTGDDYWNQVRKEFQDLRKEELNSIVEVFYYSEPEKNINYRLKEKESTVVVDYWISVNDPANGSYEYLEDLKEIVSDFGSALKFNPHYVIWEDKDLIKSGKFLNHENCLSGGRYCDADYQGNDYGRNLFYGKDAIMETLRQICLRDLEDQTAWWDYISHFMAGCLGASKEKNRNCYKTVSKLAKIPEPIAQKVEICMRESFEASANEDIQETFKDNLKLKVEAFTMDQMRINKYPALYLNDYEYRGSLRNKTMLTDYICQQFLGENIPEVCTNRGKSGHALRDIAVYLGVLLGSGIIMVILVYCVRRAVRREMMFRMSNEIPQIVTQYRTFKDESQSEKNENENDD